MVLKEKDSLAERLTALEQALASATKPAERQRLKRDLDMLRSGIKGEEDAAYLIDFELRQSPNWAVIHDLRIEHGDRVAQIDHLLLDRFLNAYVVESKNFKSKIRPANGGWERLVGNQWEGIASPADQNRRHIMVLESLITELGLAPKRLGVRMNVTYINVVAVGSECRVEDGFPRDVRVLRRDQMVRSFKDDEVPALSTLKLISSETLQSIATDLVLRHKPAPLTSSVLREEAPAYRAAPERPPAFATAALPVVPCDSCGVALSGAEDDYCRMNKSRFGGKLLCRKCQNYAPKPLAQSTPVARCIQCGCEVDAKVVAFCRFNSKRFVGRLLCRSCQNAVA